jgi:hypothetical protein
VFEQNFLAEAVRCSTGHDIHCHLWDVYFRHSVGSIAKQIVAYADDVCPSS